MEKQPGEPSQISWASAHFCGKPAQKRYGHSSRDKNLLLKGKCYVIIITDLESHWSLPLSDFVHQTDSRWEAARAGHDTRVSLYPKCSLKRKKLDSVCQNILLIMRICSQSQASPEVGDHTHDENGAIRSSRAATMATEDM